MSARACAWRAVCLATLRLDADVGAVHSVAAGPMLRPNPNAPPSASTPATVAAASGATTPTTTTPLVPTLAVGCGDGVTRLYTWHPPPPLPPPAALAAAGPAVAAAAAATSPPPFLAAAVDVKHSATAAAAAGDAHEPLRLAMTVRTRSGDAVTALLRHDVVRLSNPHALTSAAAASTTVPSSATAVRCRRRHRSTDAWHAACGGADLVVGDASGDVTVYHAQPYPPLYRTTLPRAVTRLCAARLADGDTTVVAGDLAGHVLGCVPHRDPLWLTLLAEHTGPAVADARPDADVAAAAAAATAAATPASGSTAPVAAPATAVGFDAAAAASRAMTGAAGYAPAITALCGAYGLADADGVSGSYLLATDGSGQLVWCSGSDGRVAWTTPCLTPIAAICCGHFGRSATGKTALPASSPPPGRAASNGSGVAVGGNRKRPCASTDENLTPLPSATAAAAAAAAAQSGATTADADVPTHGHRAVDDDVGCSVVVVVVGGADGRLYALRSDDDFAPVALPTPGVNASNDSDKKREHHPQPCDGAVTGLWAWPRAFSCAAAATTGSVCTCDADAHAAAATAPSDDVVLVTRASYCGWSVVCPRTGTPLLRVSEPGTVHALSVGDVDGDGQPELVVAVTIAVAGASAGTAESSAHGTVPSPASASRDGAPTHASAVRVYKLLLLDS